MSTFTNNNYATPPPLGQMNLVNGMHPAPPTQQQQLQSTAPPTQQQLQQQQHYQQQQLQFQQQQQQILQQKQQQQQRQQQQSSLSPAANNSALAANSNMNKFLPPTSLNSNFSNVSPSQLNGPTRMPPTTASNLPAHLRPPPGMNGPATDAAALALNGSGSGISANSSRTASPAMLATPTAATVNHMQQPNVPPNNSVSVVAANAAGLTSSMQNLSLNKTSMLPPTQQQPQLQQQQLPPNALNLQANFRTSALNAAATTVMPPLNNATTMPSVHRPLHAPQLPAANSPHNQQQQAATVSPLMPPTTAANMPSLSANNAAAANALQQNLLNNNQQMPAVQRRPMYPAMPPTNSQQQTLPQQQQLSTPAYAQAYQQQPALKNTIPTQPSMFNGQPNSGPLQYQSQAFATTAQQQQQPQQLQQTQTYPFPAGPSQYNQQMSVANQGFSSLWGQDSIDLMQNRHILTAATLQPPKIVLNNQFQESINCSANIMRCTIAKIPETNALLQKSRLPLGILIHPFRDINSLPVIQCPSIVRCRLCRTYINPFVYFVDSKLWKCNLCYRVNELPEDFQFDPATKTYGDVTRRPEVRSSTIEFIAPSEYMLRPPQPAIYLFLFDVSIIAQQSGYLDAVCATLSKHLDDMPGDARAQVGFIAYNSHVHFYSLAEGYNQPHEMTMVDIDEPFLPRPDNLLVNLKECKELVKDLLTQLPKRFAETHDPGSAMGSALQVAYKLMQSSGGRVTVFQTCLPNKGPGALDSREDPNNRSGKDVMHLNPATDFYKRYALECSGYQIAVDLFLLNQQYSDLATISGISKHSGGCVHHFPLYQKSRPHLVDSLKQCLTRYLMRKIGFEAVMRIRCTRGLQVHTFHGNFFVRSTDLLSLPNVNPDAGYGMQISYEESLTDVKTICFQAALLYTNSEGERRIRVHTICLPVTSSLPELMHAADAEAIVGLLSKMAVDRSLTSNMTDAREAFINATVDIFNAFKIAQNLPTGQSGQLIAPRSLALLPLYILALLKHPAFRIGTSTRLDDRVFAMDSMKTLPLDQLMKFIYPEFYQIDALFYYAQQNANSTSNSNTTDEDDEEEELPELTRLQLSAEYLDSRSVFLMDCGTTVYIYIGLNVPVNILENAFGIKSTAELPDYYYGMPSVNSAENDILKRFLLRLNDEKPYLPLVQLIRDTSTAKPQFIEKLVDDRSESNLSYYEFLQHIRSQVK